MVIAVIIIIISLLLIECSEKLFLMLAVTELKVVDGILVV